MKFNKGEYSFLALISAFYIGIVYRYQTTPKYILAITVVFAITYLIWGAIHHLRIKNLSFRIMLEYFLVAILGIAIVSTLLI
ncbi:hypothetical protein KBD75_00955 [Candidatus Woesebacteria bacterium]|nr:hypothetical protein [Candidatus Woesebacteria bacterium]